jgi:hypothetical protein
MQFVDPSSYKTVARIFKSRLDRGVVQSHKDLVYVYTLEVLVQHLRLLLCIPRSPMQLILFLDLDLFCLLSTCEDQIPNYLTGSSSHAAINAS